MSDLIRVKKPGEAWNSEAESGGGGGGGDLDDVLSNGNDAGAQQILNLADGASAQDAATVHNVDEALGSVTFNLALSNDPDAGGIELKNIGTGVDAQDAVTLTQLEEKVPTATDSTVEDFPNGVAGGTMRTLVLPADDEAVAVAIAREGDANARLIVFFPEEGGFYLAFGDGTLEPYNEGGYVGWDPATPGMYLFAPKMQLDAPTLNLANCVDINVGSLPTSDPHVAGRLWLDTSAKNVKISTG
jgi:hypothetical protein